MVQSRHTHNGKGGSSVIETTKIDCYASSPIFNANIAVHLIVFFILLFSTTSRAQTPICGPTTPVFTVNLTSSVNASWISPNIVRSDTCCGGLIAGVCVEFIITLNPNSTGIIFDIFSGAVPPGALMYQVNCSPPVAVGDPICLTGPGPHHLTFCKPGNNANEYIIQSIPNVVASPSLTINDGCSGNIWISGLDDSTLTWNSVFPSSSGAYNSYLSCTSGCDTVTVTGQPNAPPFVDYQVCGLTADGCSNIPLCDTIRVYFNPTLTVAISPVNPTICFGSPGITLTATPGGGSPPYNYLWSNGDTTQNTFAGPGTYTVSITDTSNCPPVTATVTVTQFAAAITANAGPDMSVCASSGAINLAGSVTGVTTGIWSGGAGTYSPSNTSLNMAYMPTPAEIASGSVTLQLTTTNNGLCPADSDYVTITINDFTAIIDAGTSNVTCNNFNNGTATANLSGGSAPFTFTWSTSPVQTTQTAINLGPGTYTCIITDANGCFGSFTVAITQPPAIILNASGFASTCATSCNGQVVVMPSGGVGSYTYLWAPGNMTTAAATNLCGGIYTVTVTDQNGCSETDTASILEPPPIIITPTALPAYCSLSTGSASITVTGGAGGFTYLWSPGNQTTASISNAPAGNYAVYVTDNYNCTSSLPITIGNLPPFTSALINVSNPGCANSCDGSATVATNGGYAPFQYSWNAAPFQPSPTTNTLCSGPGFVVITDSLMCADTQTVTLTAPPVLQAVLSPIPILCIGQNYTLVPAVSGGTAPYSYSWPNGGPAITATAASASYSMIVTDINGCTDTSLAYTISTYPPLSVTISGNPASCYNSTTTLNATASGGNGGPYTYNWSPSSATTSSITFTTVGNTVYTVSASDNCTLPDATATFSVSVLPLPIVSFSVSDTSGCGTDCTDLVNTTPNTNSLSWLLSDGFSGTDSIFNHCFGVGTHSATLTVTDNNGCTGTTTNPSVMTIHPTPIAAFTMSPLVTTIMEPDICFTDQSSSDAITWYWNFSDPNDITTSTIQNTCHTYSDTGTYCATLIVTNSFGCFDEETQCIIIQPFFTLYVPNAFTPNADGMNDLFFPVGHSIDEDNYEFLIFDRWGNLIFKSTTWGEGWNGSVQNSGQTVQMDAYVWKINVTDYTGAKHKLIGHVSLIK